MVIGSGVAGMEAARVAALRGYRAEIYEKDAHLGGVAPPGRRSNHTIAICLSGTRSG